MKNIHASGEIQVSTQVNDAMLSDAPMQAAGARVLSRRRLASAWRPARQLCRVFSEQVFDARQALGGVDSSEAIHLARRHIKRARSTLRLIRTAIDQDALARTDDLLHSAAKLLGPIRDREVLRHTLASFGEKIHTPRGLAALQAAYARADRKSHSSAVDADATTASALLGAASELASSWNVADAWYSPTESAAQIYRRARKVTRRVALDRNSELHALRRHTQYLRFALEAIALEPARELDDLLRSLGKLSDLLGKDHDLQMLEAALQSRARRSTIAASQSLLKSIRKRRIPLQQRALKLARHLYDSKPRRFAMQLEAQWLQWEERLLH